MQIRFFERVKFERRIKQLEREIQSGDPSTDADPRAKLAQAREDLQVRFFDTSTIPVSCMAQSNAPTECRAL